MRVAVALDAESNAFGQVLGRSAARFGEGAKRRTEYMRFGMCGRFVDALAAALDEISCADSDGLDEQRRRAVPQVVKGPQIDEGVLAGIAKQTVDKGFDRIAVGLGE